MPRKVSVFSPQDEAGRGRQLLPDVLRHEVTGMSRVKSLPSVPLMVPGWLL
jgi:hypothetical protein